MEVVTQQLVRHAQELAQEVAARAVLVYADAIQGDGGLRAFLQAVDFPTILVTRSTDATVLPGFESRIWVTVPDIPMTRVGQVKAAVLVCLVRGILTKGDRVVCLSGAASSKALDSLVVLNLGSEPELFSLFNSVKLTDDILPEVFERVLTLATQLGVEGREGRPVGALFVIGDSDRVLAQSRNLVLNPFLGHPEAQRNLLDPALGETIKEFSALDGAFVIRGDGVVLTAGSQLAPAMGHARLPSGLGTRHAAAADITATTNAVSLCVSQSTGTVSVFKSGHLVTDIQRPASSERLSL
jgi:DNA integrity scanning protein DisA with diadenylate cyclase activity